MWIGIKTARRHSSGILPTDRKDVCSSINGSSRLGDNFLTNNSGKPSFPLARFGFSLAMARFILVGLNVIIMVYEDVCSQLAALECRYVTIVYSASWTMYLPGERRGHLTASGCIHACMPVASLTVTLTARHGLHSPPYRLRASDECAIAGWGGFVCSSSNPSPKAQF